MKIKINKQFDKSGEEYLQEKEIEIGIEKVDDYILIEIDGEQIEIPQEAFFGILGN